MRSDRGHAGPGDRTSKLTYLSKQELDNLKNLATPNQALAESQGTFACKVACFNTGCRGDLKDQKKIDTVGGDGSGMGMKTRMYNPTSLDFVGLWGFFAASGPRDCETSRCPKR